MFGWILLTSPVSLSSTVFCHKNLAGLMFFKYLKVIVASFCSLNTSKITSSTGESLYGGKAKRKARANCKNRLNCKVSDNSDYKANMFGKTVDI